MSQENKFTSKILKYKNHIIAIVISIIPIYEAYNIESLKIDVSKTEMKYEVESSIDVVFMALQMQNAFTNQQIVDAINGWKKNHWTAQLGHLKFICDNDPNSMVKAMKVDNQSLRYICSPV